MKNQLVQTLSICASLSLVMVPAAMAHQSPKVLHQTSKSVMVRLGADDNHVVWQETGDQPSEHYLYALDSRTGQKTRIQAPKRPFAPSVSNGYLLFGAGHLQQKIDVDLVSLDSGKAFQLNAHIPWIVEPFVQVTGDRVQAVWEKPLNDDGDGMAIELWEGNTHGKGHTTDLVRGAILRDDLPPESQRLVHSEYPRLSGTTLAFQSNEFGQPNIYRFDLVTHQATRLAPTGFFQERPWIDGRYTVWEQSETGYATATESTIWLHDSQTGQARQISAERGFHYQARVFGDYVIYGAKREPMAHTPSLRVYDIKNGVELQAQKCFTSAVYDWAPTHAGVYAAQRVTESSSQLVYVTWQQLLNECR